MRYRGIVLSTALIALFNYGCVKPTDSRGVNQKEQSSDGGQVYNEQPTQVSYDEATTTISQTQQDNIYPESSTTESSYQTQTTSQSGDVYGADSIYSQSGSSTSQYGSGGDIYSGGSGSNTYGGSSSSGYGSSDDPYAQSSGGAGDTYGAVDDPYSATPSSRYSTNTPYSSSGSSSYGSGSSSSGVQLQVAAFKEYPAAEEFKRNLSIPPQYSSYIQRGSVNKVIITGIPSRAKAKELANRQFPGAFIVSGSQPSVSSYPSSSSYSGSQSSYSGNPSANLNSGIGVQVGAFSSKEKARAMAQEKAKGKYTAVVKTATAGGRTIYKAIILGFKDRASAKRAIDAGEFGSAFVVSGIYP